MKYYIAIVGQESGPFTLEQLKNQKLSPDTLVSKPGLPDWLRADQIPEIHELFNTLPPSLPVPPQQISGETHAKPSSPADEKSTNPSGGTSCTPSSVPPSTLAGLNDCLKGLDDCLSGCNCCCYLVIFVIGVIASITGLVKYKYEPKGNHLQVENIPPKAVKEQNAKELNAKELNELSLFLACTGLSPDFSTQVHFVYTAEKRTKEITRRIEEIGPRLPFRVRNSVFGASSGKVLVLENRLPHPVYNVRVRATSAAGASVGEFVNPRLDSGGSMDVGSLQVSRNLVAGDSVTVWIDEGLLLTTTIR